MGSRAERSLRLLAVAATFSACSSQPGPSARDAADANDTGRTVSAKSAAERALLEAIPRLPSGSSQRVGGVAVVADAPYSAASGRTCRALHVKLSAKETQSERLACTDGKGWFFVPDVFGTTAAAE